MSESRIDLAETADFELGGLIVSPAHRQVRWNGQRRELEPRVAQVLVALASVSPRVVSRNQLIERCWDGRVVGDDALNRCIVALRQLAKEFSPEPYSIETVSRVGYNLIRRGSATVEAKRQRLRPWALAALTLTVLLIATGAALTIGWLGLNGGVGKPASIAVLPFRNLSDGSPFFAQGISEEILSQLAREPQFRVAGGNSSSQFRKDPDIREVARRLDVDYVVEGSVRAQGDRVRVTADLVRASDGRRLWTDSYDGNLADIFAIQQRIGSGVTGALTRKLIHSSPGAVRSVNGEAYALYLNARGLVRSGNPESGQDAVAVLQEAIRLDPKFAAAWSSLAEALTLKGSAMGTEGLIAILPEAQAAARHALELDPNLAEAHGVLGKLVGEDTPEGLAQVRRAGELDPRSGQGQIWQGAAHYISGEYLEGLAAYRRAHDLDPLWPTPVQVLVDVTSGMGDRAAAEALVRQGFPDDPMRQQFGLARVAWLSGDFSEAARRWSIIASEPSSRWASPAKLSLEDTLFLLKLSSNSPSRPTRPSVGQNRQGPRVWMSQAPPPSEWRNRNRSFAASLVNHEINVVAAKRMLAASRGRELVESYYGPTGLLLMRPGVPVGVCDLHEAALVALALRAAGRHDEADTLLRQSDAQLQAAYHRGQVPTWFDEDAAAIWAVQGKTSEAIDALERAFRRGAAHVGRTDLPKLEDEPALRSLHGNPRFEALRLRYEAHFAREREETARALNIRPAVPRR
jgi:TolB-like protein/DNA-binding winged helix-turn-helix (wHTH) protein/tetratricopeptide (TPR) repeat protein